MRLPQSISIPEEVLEIAGTLERAGHEAWCVGGALRDVLLDEPHAVSDFDIATSATPAEVQALFRRTAAVGAKYGTIGVIDRRRVLHEVTTFRRDVITDGRHAVVEYGVSLAEDLARRDFTINAIAYHPIRREWQDPFGGLGDLRDGLVRAVGDPAQRFREDYLRILRGIRFAARFGFTIEPATWSAGRRAASGLANLSAERVRDEWFKGLRTARSVAALVSLWRGVGATTHWMPELDRTPPEILARAAELPLDRRDPVLLTALLTATPGHVLRRLRASSAEVDRGTACSEGPPAPEGIDEPAVRRWLSRVGTAAEDLLALWVMRHGAEPAWAPVVRAVRQRGDALTRADLAITGNDLRDAGASGRRIGEILSMLMDRVLETPALNTRETLLAMAREML
ncbi:MAG TPA: CCA tRNA nucleotidyltransferase [Gemmatimonadales bacterium]|jgi:tRNA nucleotidyltransferase (CCA-adding enzyme)|nr:CCA tRNA nucleotidyltransferase [Gemmatimonadales bacterium]